MLAGSNRQAYSFRARWYLRRLTLGILFIWLAQAGGVAANPPSEPVNPVEAFAWEWESKAALVDQKPTDPLALALYGYFKKLFAAFAEAVRREPTDIARMVGETRERLADDTARMIETFVAAGYRRLDAELYFDRLYARLQGDLFRMGQRDKAASPKLIKPEDAAVSDRLIAKADDLFYDNKDPVGALKALDDALRFAPANVRLTLDTARQLQKFGQLAEAREYFDRARQLYPQVVYLFFSTGNVRVSTQDYYGAIEDLTTAIHLLPTAARAYSIRGNARLALDDYEGAIDDYGMQIAIGAPEGLESVYNRRAQAHYFLGHLEIARTDAGEAVRRQPRYAAGFRTLGLIEMRLGNYGAALAALNRSVELRPDIAATYSNRMWVYYEVGSADSAMRDADSLVRISKDNAFNILIRAALHDVLDRTETAESGYRAAIARATESRDNTAWYYAHLHLDMLLRRFGRSETSYLDDVLDWQDDWPKRVALHLTGRITADSLLQAARQAPKRNDRINQECEANYYAGMLLWLAGRREAAVPYLQVAASPVHSGNVEYNQARKLLRQAGVPLDRNPAPSGAP